MRQPVGRPQVPGPTSRPPDLAPPSHSTASVDPTGAVVRIRQVAFEHMDVHPADFPIALTAVGSRDAAFQPVLDAADLPDGTMRRVTRGELDLLLVHTPDGIVATDDRCPHMSAPLSIGDLDGCIV